jgi:subtilase family serine protease
MNKPLCCVALWAILEAASPALLAQPDRISTRIDSSQTVVLTGRVPRQATAQNDAGPVDASFRLAAITLMLKTSPAQQADLNQLLMAQQDSTSPSYRQWLTPEQYADRFGVSTGDLAKITAWLESQGFTVGYTARGRSFLSFSGTAQQVANAFHTQIHRYNVNGVTHYANATDPSIPAALAGMVSAIRGLNDFKQKPHYRTAQPQITVRGYGNVVGPDDFAAIYDVAKLYNSSPSITGAGQKIAIVGQSEIHTSDITSFRNAFGLGAPNLDLVLVPGALGGGNPGYSAGDQAESDLDVEWSGAVAKGATVVFVYAANGVGASEPMYAIDQNLAPVLSTSYGFCEEGRRFARVWLPRKLRRSRRNAEGITLLAAAGRHWRRRLRRRAAG